MSHQLNIREERLRAAKAKAEAEAKAMIVPIKTTKIVIEPNPFGLEKENASDVEDQERPVGSSLKKHAAPAKWKRAK